MKNIRRLLHDKRSALKDIAIGAFLGSIFFILSALPLSTKAMTFDEGYHLVRGVALLQTGDFRINVHHPYLGNMLIALPTLFDEDLKTFDEQSLAWREAQKDDLTIQFIDNNGGILNFSGEALFYPRLFQSFLTALFVGIYYIVLKRLFGFKTALVAALFLALSPSMLAHGSIVTTDIQATSTIFLATIALYRHIKRKENKEKRFFILFLFLALAALMVKYSALFCLPIWLLAALWDAERRDKSPKFITRVFKASKIAFLSVGFWFLAIFLMYGAQFKTFQELEYENEDRIEQVKEDIGDTGTPDAVNFYESAKLPMPYYIKGFFENVLYKNVAKHETYFLGQYHNIGPEYYIVALLTKETLFFAISLIAASFYTLITLIARIRKSGKSADIDPATFLIYSVPLFLLLLAMMSTVRLGIRHILPVIPFITLLFGVFYNDLLERFSLKKTGALLIAGFLFSAISILYQYPNFIGYFNEAVGYQNGYKVLHDSNLDWGQNEIIVANYMAENSTKQIVYIDSWDDRLMPGRYHIVRLVNVFGDPLYQPQIHQDIRKLYEEGEIERIEWIENTHWLIYYEGK